MSKAFDPGKVLSFIEKVWMGEPGRYRMSPGGEETLYSSCFAVMTLHYLGRLETIPRAEKEAWITYIQSWQDKTTGFFVGPEIIEGELTSKSHDKQHILFHLTAHVLPALALLNAKPLHKLKFMDPFLEPSYLLNWLNKRDWRDAWLEGNNLLFVGQFLIYLRDSLGYEKIGILLDQYFDWLDEQLDANTGLWGTNGFCSPFVAMCGGYHQLLAYYYEKRPVRFQERLIDTVLSLQHPDGGFSPRGGGGACEDVDAADILVNLYKMNNYRRRSIRIALKRLQKLIVYNQLDDGGFVYKRKSPFVYMGIVRTITPADVSNMFATWFRVHTLALIAEILGGVNGQLFQFNNICSMGWHQPWDKKQMRLTRWESTTDQVQLILVFLRGILGKLETKIKALGRKFFKINKV